MIVLVMYIDNSYELCKDIYTVDVFIVVLLVGLHGDGTNHNHPKYMLAVSAKRVDHLSMTNDHFSHSVCLGSWLLSAKYFSQVHLVQY